MSNEAKSLLHYAESLKTGVDAEWTLNAVQVYAAHLLSNAA